MVVLQKNLNSAHDFLILQTINIILENHNFILIKISFIYNNNHLWVHVHYLKLPTHKYQEIWWINVFF